MRFVEIEYCVSGGLIKIVRPPPHCMRIEEAFKAIE